MNTFILAIANSSIPGVSAFLDFLQIVTILFGIPKMAQGAWQISRGHFADGLSSMISGFLCCISVPTIRLMASWNGTTI